LAQCPGNNGTVVFDTPNTVLRWDRPYATDNYAMKNQTATLNPGEELFRDDCDVCRCESVDVEQSLTVCACRVAGIVLPRGDTRINFTAFDFFGNRASCSFIVRVQEPPALAAASSSSNPAAVGGAVAGLLIILVLLGILLYRRSRRKMLELEEKAKFQENEAWIIARAQVRESKRSGGGEEEWWWLFGC
jgi:hypothetical protein